MSSIHGPKTPSSAPAALVYITLGALLSVWSGIWFLYEQNSANASRGVYYLCAGLLMTGIALLAIGLGVGRLAHRAHSAEIAQEEAKIGAIRQDPSMANKV